MSPNTDHRRGSADGTSGDQPPLAFEAEFDGSRQVKSPRDPQPCDPGRYWDFFSGTD